MAKGFANCGSKARYVVAKPPEPKTALISYPPMFFSAGNAWVLLGRIGSIIQGVGSLVSLSDYQFKILAIVGNRLFALFCSVNLAAQRD